MVASACQKAALAHIPPDQFSVGVSSAIRGYHVVHRVEMMVGTACAATSPDGTGCGLVTGFCVELVGPGAGDSGGGCAPGSCPSIAAPQPRTMAMTEAINFDTGHRKRCRGHTLKSPVNLFLLSDHQIRSFRVSAQTTAIPEDSEDRRRRNGNSACVINL
jgi:hypothetical protein